MTDGKTRLSKEKVLTAIAFMCGLLLILAHWRIVATVITFIARLLGWIE